MQYLKILTVTALIASSTVFAGGDSSSGGGAMVCRGSDGKIQTAYLLDLWEMQFAENPTEILRSDEDVEAQVGKAVDRVKASLGTRAAEELRRYLKTVRSTVREVKPGFELTPPSDALNDLNQIGCKLEGVALYNDRKDLLYVNPEILNAMPKTDQAALWIHEAIYKARRDAKGDKNSIATREYVGWLFGSNYSRTDLGTDSYILCRTDDPRWGELKVIFLKWKQEAGYHYFNASEGRHLLAALGWEPGMSHVDSPYSEILNLVDRKISPSELSHAQSLIEQHGRGKSGLKTINFWQSVDVGDQGVRFPNVYLSIAAAGMTEEEGLIMTTRPDQEIYADIDYGADLSKTLFTYKMKKGFFRGETLKSITRNQAVQPLCKRYPLSGDSPLPY